MPDAFSTAVYKCHKWNCRQTNATEASQGTHLKFSLQSTCQLSRVNGEGFTVGNTRYVLAAALPIFHRYRNALDAPFLDHLHIPLLRQCTQQSASWQAWLRVKPMHGKQWLTQHPSEKCG